MIRQELRNEQVQSRVSQTESRQLREAAARDRISVSAFIRKVVMDEVERRLEQGDAQ